MDFIMRLECISSILIAKNTDSANNICDTVEIHNIQIHGHTFDGEDLIE